MGGRTTMRNQPEETAEALVRKVVASPENARRLLARKPRKLKMSYYVGSVSSKSVKR